MFTGATDAAVNEATAVAEAAVFFKQYVQGAGNGNQTRGSATATNVVFAPLACYSFPPTPPSDVILCSPSNLSYCRSVGGSLIALFGERPEQFAPFLVSNLSDSLTSLTKKEGISDLLIF